MVQNKINRRTAQDTSKNLKQSPWRVQNPTPPLLPTNNGSISKGQSKVCSSSTVLSRTQNTRRKCKPQESVNNVSSYLHADIANAPRDPTPPGQATKWTGKPPDPGTEQGRGASGSEKKKREVKKRNLGARRGGEEATESAAAGARGEETGRARGLLWVRCSVVMSAWEYSRLEQPSSSTTSALARRLREPRG
jgi:hypothetical protein